MNRVIPAQDVLEDLLVRLQKGEHLLSVDRGAIVDAYRRLKQDVKTLEGQVLVDALTGVWNRRYLDQHLTHLSEHAQNPDYRGDSWVVVIDGDNIKHVNDTAGHDVGDHAIQLIAKYLTKAGRPGDMIFRFGGDEFVLTYPKMPRDSVPQRLKNIVDRFPQYLEHEAPVQLHGVTLSVGAASIEAGSDAQTALKHADTAMYRAKQQRDDWCVYTPSSY